MSALSIKKILVAGLLVFWGVQGAWATPPKPCIYGGKNINSLIQKSNAGGAVSDDERGLIEAFDADTKTACEITGKLWPVCSISGSGDMAPNCQNISSGGVLYEKDGWKFKVSPKEMEELEKRKQQLEGKWADKQ